MSEIKKIIKIPFQKIDSTVKFVKMEKMNELESLLMVLITSSTELGFKKETLREAIGLKYGIKDNTLPLIKIAIKSLLSSKTIGGDENVDSLLEKNIRRINKSIDAEIISGVQQGIFNKRTKKYRKDYSSVYENIIAGTNLPKKIKESDYDGVWKSKPMSKEQMRGISESEVMKLIRDDEHMEKFELDDEKSVVKYIESEITLKKSSDNVIHGTNSLFNIVLAEIKNGNLDADRLTSMLDTSIQEIAFRKEDGIAIENNRIDIKNINRNKYIIENNKVMKLFNKKVEYKVAEIDQILFINELYGKEVLLKDFANEIIENGSVNIIPSLKSINNELREFFLNIKIEETNLPFAKYYFDKESFENKITKLSFQFNEIYSEMDIREILKNTNKKIIVDNLHGINIFIEKYDLTKLYEVVYEKAGILYNANTKLFPLWKKEISHFNFIKDLPKIESKISLIDTKDDAEKVLTFLSKYNFSPIKSSVLNQLKKTAKELSMSSSLDTSQNIKFYGSRIRMILEHIINKEEKEVFSQRLEKEIKEKNIDKSDKKVLLSIYKSTNLFHHNSDFEVNRNLEVKIKNDIIKLSEIAKRNKVKINKFEKEIKWATV